MFRCFGASVTSLRTIRNTYPAQAWPGHVPIDTRFRDASKAGVPPHLFDSTSRGVEAYVALWHWLEKKIRADELQTQSAPMAVISKAGVVS